MAGMTSLTIIILPKSWMNFYSHQQEYKNLPIFYCFKSCDRFVVAELERSNGIRVLFLIGHTVRF